MSVDHPAAVRYQVAQDVIADSRDGASRTAKRGLRILGGGLGRSQQEPAERDRGRDAIKVRPLAQRPQTTQLFTIDSFS
jgi:hypothetical protein